MAFELMYTSAPQGLKPGSRGFCTVACTQGLSPPLAQRLEALSSYRRVFGSGDPRENDNPVNFSHVRCTIGASSFYVVSRTCYAGLDYSQRFNKFSHHVVLDASELPAGGPAWLAAQAGFLQTTWDGQVRLLPTPPKIPRGDTPPRVCKRWEEIAGDAGWAGVVARTVLNERKRFVYLAFEPGMDLLPLIQEVVALLPQSKRWEATFATYCTNLPPNVVCQIRGVLIGSDEDKTAIASPQSLRIDLTQKRPLNESGEWIEAARSGNPPLLEAARLVPTRTKVESWTPTPEAQGVSLIEVAEDKDDDPGPRPTSSHRHKRPQRRSNPLPAALALLVVLVAAGLGGFTWWATTGTTPLGAPAGPGPIAGKSIPPRVETPPGGNRPIRDRKSPPTETPPDEKPSNKDEPKPADADKPTSEPKSEQLEKPSPPINEPPPAPPPPPPPVPEPRPEFIEPEYASDWLPEENPQVLTENKVLWGSIAPRSDPDAVQIIGFDSIGGKLDFRFDSAKGEFVASEKGTLEASHEPFSFFFKDKGVTFWFSDKWAPTGEERRNLLDRLGFCVLAVETETPDKRRYLALRPKAGNPSSATGSTPKPWQLTFPKASAALGERTSDKKTALRDKPNWYPDELRLIELKLWQVSNGVGLPPKDPDTQSRPSGPYVFTLWKPDREVGGPPSGPKEMEKVLKDLAKLKEDCVTPVEITVSLTMPSDKKPPEVNSVFSLKDSPKDHCEHLESRIRDLDQRLSSELSKKNQESAKPDDSDKNDSPRKEKLAAEIQALESWLKFIREVLRPVVEEKKAKLSGEFFLSCRLVRLLKDPRNSDNRIAVEIARFDPPKSP